MSEQAVYSSIGHQLFLMHHVKKPLMEGVRALTAPDAPKLARLEGLRQVWRAYKNFKKLPPPTIGPGPGQVFHPDAVNMLRLRDWFLSSCRLAEIRLTFVSGIFEFAAIIMQMDPPWRFIARQVRLKAEGMDWAPEDCGGQLTEYPWWNEL